MYPRKTRMVLGLLAGLTVLQFPGCGSVGALIDDCFGSGTLSPSEYDDLNFLAQLGYQENGCGRYAPRDSSLGGFLDDVDDWFD